MSVTTSKNTKAAVLALVQALIAGTNKHFPSGSFTLGKVVYSTASLLQLFQSLAAAMTAVGTAQASVKDALSALSGIETSVLPVLRAYVRFLHATFGIAVQDLADFGLAPPKARAPRTGEQLAAAAAKARATRAARGTTSKKQKLAVKGNVAGITVVPVIEAAPPSPQPQPAPGASSGSPQTPSK